MIGDRVWYGGATLDRVARTALVPVSAAYGAGVAIRNALFDRGILAAHQVDLPTLSVGNLTVGGTGKTPIAALMAAKLLVRGARPAIVLRGYGGDEAAVHQRLNPSVPVIVDADRVRGVAEAARERCDVAVLDDGFQHRRASRAEDLVLISADRWREPIRTLPAGPWREPMSSLQRATLVMVTRKGASADAARSLLAALSHWTGGEPPGGAVAALCLDLLREVQGQRTLPPERLRGEHVLVFAGIGDPGSLERQVRSLGARVEMRCFPDHHRYGAAEITQLASRAETVDRAICTLKDAVKLHDKWPRQAPPLWYFSQRVEIEQGQELVDAMLQRLLDTRR